MKKISLIALISTFVILATMLTGCTPSATPTGKELRFSNEKFVFNISLERSAQVDNEMVVKDGTTETKYVEDYQMLPYNYDEIRPVAAKGVLTVEINTDDTAKYTLTTSQTIYAIYNKSEFTDALLDSLTAEQSLDINGFNAEEQQLQIDTKTLQQYIDEGKVALRSVTDTYTEFEAKKTQQPLKSTKALTGYYLGYSNQQYSQYTTESEYNYENGATVKVTKTTDGKESISNHQLASNTIDINQYILYSRTLDKGENTFGDNPSVQVFDPFSATTATANFAISKSAKSVLTFNGERTPVVNDIVVGYINGTALYYISNVPYDSEQKVDVKGAQDGIISKFTVIKIQNGYFSMQLDTFDADVQQFLTAKTQTAEE